MPTSEAQIRTPHSGKYLAQLCRHAEAISHRPGQRLHDHVGPDHAHPRIQHVERSDTDATLTFDQGRCIVRADADALTLRVEADDVASRQRIEKLIGADVERFGSRQHLTVAWRNCNDEDNHDHDHSHDDHSHDDDSHGSGPSSGAPSRLSHEVEKRYSVCDL